MKRHYPRTIFTDTNTVQEQLEHIRSELVETIREAEIDKRGLTAEEACDFEHSIQTVLDQLHEQYGIDIDATRERVIEKNRARGYYSWRKQEIKSER